MCFGIDLFWFILFRVFSTSWVILFMIFAKLEMFSTIVYLKSFRFYIFFLLRSRWYKFYLFHGIPISPLDSVSAPTLYFLCCSHCVNSIALSQNSLILSSVIFTVLLIPFSDFLKIFSYLIYLPLVSFISSSSLPNFLCFHLFWICSSLFMKTFFKQMD